MRKLLNNLNISYRCTYNSNRNNVVLLLHGWGGNLNSFRYLEKNLITNGFSVITLDFPGFGGSEQPPENFSMLDYYKIVSELIKYENITELSVIAHSFGGRVAILLSALEQEKVKNLILCDSAGLKPKFSLLKQIKIWNYKILKKLKNAGIIKKDLINYGSSDYKALPENMKPVFNRVVNTDLTKYLKDIICPTLIIWGTKDDSTPFYMAKKLNKNIKDSAIVSFAGCGHFCYLQQPERFQIIVENFLNQE